MPESRIRPWQLHRATQALLSGGVIAYPTEAVFGLGCLPNSGPSIVRLLTLKHRSKHKGLIIVAAHLRQLSEYIYINDKVNFPEVLSTWPGPVTWLLPAKLGISELLTGGSDLLAVRVSAHPIIQSICRQTGPIISTSANPSNSPPALTTRQIRAYFRDSLDYIFPGQLGQQSKPTEIRNGLTGKIIRASS